MKAHGVKFLDDSVVPEAIITVRRISWFGLKSEIKRYRGSGTVWHDAATGARASTNTEMKLSDFYTFYRWNRGKS